MRYLASTLLLLTVLSLCAASAQEPLDSVRRVTPEEAWQFSQKGKAIIVDVRDEGPYKAGHVKGALGIRLDEIGSRVKELPRDKMIITYDSSLREHTSARAVLDLNAKGIKTPPPSSAVTTPGSRQATRRQNGEEVLRPGSTHGADLATSLAASGH
jgi:rhodanese-related sulfurtransferase